MTVTGYNMVFLANPLFRSLLFESSEQINYPYNDHGFDTDQSLYTVWSELQQQVNNTDENLRLVTTGSDYGPFEYYSGIPCIGVRFDTYPESFPDVYHTFFDLNGVLDIMDPEWKYAEQIAKLGGLLMLKVAQAQILPWDVVRFGQKMQEWVEVDLTNYAESRSFTCSLEDYIGELEDSVNAFGIGTYVFDDARQDYYDRYDNDEDKMDPDEVKEFNVILMELTRMLTLKFPDGMPNGKWYKQIIIDPGNQRFPFIWDTITNGCDDAEMRAAVNITAEMILNASSLLNSIVIE